MLSIKQITKSEYENKQKKKIEKELPYFITFVALLSTSGFGPYTIFQKVQEIKLLPTIRKEAEKILKRIDLMGFDPLSAMLEAKDKPSSKALGEFLSGYVSSIQGGGNVASFLKSKMNGAFDRYAEIQHQSISKVKALVESYMTLQVVVLAVYIILTAVSSSEGVNAVQQDSALQYLIILLPPLISAGFMAIAHQMNQSKISELDLKKVAMFGAPAIALSMVIIFLGLFENQGPLILGFALIAVSVWPTLKFTKIHQMGLDAESATPQILRDIAETRKAGLGPEKSVIRACSRKDFGLFNSISEAIANKLKWGIPFENIFDWLEAKIRDFQVLINFKILFEIIKSGGGNATTLDSLAGISEKIHSIEKTKRELLKPYVMIGFLLIGMTGFITLLVIDSLASISMQSETTGKKIAEIEQQSKEQLELYSYAVIVQGWLAGLFLGKITTGTYSGGFKYSLFLVVITIVAITLIQNSVFDVNSLFRGFSVEN